MPQFEWKTDDTSVSWHSDESIKLASPQGTAETTVTGWGKLAVLTVFLFMGGFVLALQWSAQIGRRETEITADVQDSYQLLQEMMRTQDIALLPNVALNPEQRWWQESSAAFEQQQFMQFTLAGWERTDVSIDEIEIYPDHFEAVVYTTAHYEVYERSAVAQTVTLQQQFVFKQSNGRWLWSGFAARTWQQTAEKQGAYLTTTYPLNDQTQALAVHRAIDAAVGRYCHFTPGNSCPFDLQLHLTLSESPTAAFPAYDTGQLPPSAITQITLPTPALIGRPAADTAPSLLYQQYAAHMIAILNAHFLAALTDTNHPSRLLYHALLDDQLKALDLPPIIPYTQSNTKELPITLDSYNDAWSADQQQLCLDCIRPLIEFLRTTHPQMTSLTMQKQLYQAPTFEMWLNNITVWDKLTREKAWQQFQITHATQD